MSGLMWIIWLVLVVLSVIGWALAYRKEHDAWIATFSVIGGWIIVLLVGSITYFVAGLLAAMIINGGM